MSTSRLKKRIEQVSNGDSKGYGNLLESFVSYGTALPSLASTSKDSNEFVPIWKQEVYDEQGRRRLHGAFTGGFSAGYFNTVGSKEGWTPKSFTSSRSTRAAKDDQSTEDLAKSLMDEEDLADLQSTKSLQTASAYSNPTPAYDPISGHSSSTRLAPTAALASLIQPSTTRIGLQLMRKMGWKEGQGVGPRVTLEQRRKIAKELGIQIDDEEDDGAGEASKHYYAPLDRPLNTLKEVGSSADRGWGLGYFPSASLSTSARIESSATSAQWNGMDEDDSIYNASNSGGSRNSEARPKWVVDLETEEQEDGEYIIEGTGNGRGQQHKGQSKQSTFESFHDNSKCLSGFKIHRETNVGASTSQLPMPPPSGWSSNPSRVWRNAESGALSKGKAKEMDSDQRGNLLGEPQPAAASKSVFEYMSAKSRERIAQISSNPASFNPGTSSNSTPLTSTSRALVPPPIEPDDPLSIPTLDPPTALAALSGFQPFSPTSASADSARQARYTLFLRFQARLLPPTSTPSTLPFGPRILGTGKMQTIRELNRELDDYARAARVFKPVSGMLAGRFTSTITGGVLEVPTVTPGLSQPKPKVVQSIIEEPDRNILVENLTSAQSAARAGMFGRMTRLIDEFHPAKLLCKRFGIRNPYPDEEVAEVEAGGTWKEAGRGPGFSRKSTGDVLNKESMEQLMRSSGFRKFESTNESSIDSSLSTDADAAAQFTIESSIDMKREGERKTLANVGLGEDETQGADILTYQKAPADIFAAIFAVSDDEDDEEDNDPPTILKTLPTLSPPLLDSIRSSPQSLVIPSASSADVEPLSIENLSSFRPSFVSASKMKKDSTEPGIDKKKKSNKRKATKAALSFDVEEEVTETFEKKRKVNELSAQEDWVVADSTVHRTILVKQGGRSRAADLF